MIALQLLGGLTVASGQPLNIAVRRRHAAALLALVASSAPTPLGREKLLGYLWPESDAERARSSLRQAIFTLRREIADGLFLPETAGGGMLLDPAQVTVDLWDFRAAMRRRAFEEAVAAYGGLLLDGFDFRGLPEFSRWVEAERDALQWQYMEALEALASTATREGRHDEAVAWRRRQATVDPTSTPIALALIQALTDAGDRTGALRYISLHERLVRDQLDADLDPAVTALAASLRRTPTDSPVTAPMRSATDAAGGAEPPAIPVSTGAAPDASPPEGPDAAPAPELDASRSFAPALGFDAPPHPVPAARRVRRLPRLLVALALVVAGIVASTALVARDHSSGDRGTTAREGIAQAAGGVGAAQESEPRVMSSGEYGVDDRDAATRLVACEGPACPAGPLPQAAFMVPTHVFHMPPARGTTYVAPVRDGTSRPSPGYPCCTLATFERAFILPPEATTATVAVSVHADNSARVAVNGVEFGRHRDSVDTKNFEDSATTFTHTFTPDPSGTNQLRVVLWDGGGALAVHYRATVRFSTATIADRAKRRVSLGWDTRVRRGRADSGRARVGGKSN